MSEKSEKDGSPICQGIRSPMNPYEQQMTQRMPELGTTEVIRGSAPDKVTHINSPTKSRATGDATNQ